jgi:hypothetical protein
MGIAIVKGSKLPYAVYRDLPKSNQRVHSRLAQVLESSSSSSINFLDSYGFLDPKASRTFPFELPGSTLMKKYKAALIFDNVSERKLIT